MSPKQPSIFPCPDYVHWPQEVRDYLTERERYFIDQGVAPADARQVAIRMARQMNHELVTAKEQLARRSPEELQAAARARREEVDRVNQEYAAMQAMIRAPKRRR